MMNGVGSHTTHAFFFTETPPCTYPNQEGIIAEAIRIGSLTSLDLSSNKIDHSADLLRQYVATSRLVRNTSSKHPLPHPPPCRHGRGPWNSFVDRVVCCRLCRTASGCRVRDEFSRRRRIVEYSSKDWKGKHALLILVSEREFRSARFTLLRGTHLAAVPYSGCVFPTPT